MQHICSAILNLCLDAGKACLAPVESLVRACVYGVNRKYLGPDVFSSG